MQIDPMFGGWDGFRSFMKAAKKHGISVILDGVFNHTGDDSIYFNKYGKYDTVGAYQSKESPYAEWFNFTEFPEEYESWWGFKNLPRVMSDKPAYKKFLFDEDGVIEITPGVYNIFKNNLIELKTANDELVKKGVVGMYDNFKVIMSNGLVKDSTN
jgi:glycosidase